MLIHAKYLLNPQETPLHDPYVWIQGDTLRYVGARDQVPAEAFTDPDQHDWTGMALSPGLVNAHSHLELTALANIPYSGSFVEWIRAVLNSKTQLSPEAERHSIQTGVALALRGGTTCVGDHLSVQGDVETLLNSPLRGRVFLEILGVNPAVAQDLWSSALALYHGYENFPSRLKISLTPHSVHALTPEILKQILAKAFDCFSVHLAESAAEQKYFQEQSGEMFDLIAERGYVLCRPAHSSIAELRGQGFLNAKLAAVHANYCSENEIAEMARQGVSVVHCPFSHDYFSHQPFPLQAFMQAGVNVALGTDSLASATTLSMLEVLRRMQGTSKLSREQIFSMATLGGAKALKLDAQIGSVAVGKKADLIAVPLAGQEPLDSLFTAQQVTLSIIGGEIVSPS